MSHYVRTSPNYDRIGAFPLAGPFDALVNLITPAASAVTNAASGALDAQLKLIDRIDVKTAYGPPIRLDKPFDPDTVRAAVFQTRKVG